MRVAQTLRRARAPRHGEAIRHNFRSRLIGFFGYVQHEGGGLSRTDAGSQMRREEFLEAAIKAYVEAVYDNNWRMGRQYDWLQHGIEREAADTMIALGGGVDELWTFLLSEDARISQL